MRLDLIRHRLRLRHRNSHCCRQSGRPSGNTFIQGGEAVLRQALHMPALVTSRFNPDLEAAYTRVLKVGKPAKVTITAIMRKPLLIANALSLNNRPWSEKTA